VFLKEEPEIPESVIRIREEDIEQYPVHRLMEYYIEKQINGSRERGEGKTEAKEWILPLFDRF
jgi:hypothetical protein